MTISRRILACAAALLIAAVGCGNSQKTDAAKSTGSEGAKQSTSTGGAKSGGAKTGASKTGGKTAAATSSTTGSTKSTAAKSAGGWYLTENDNGKHLELHPGDLILVKLGASRANGYQWVEHPSDAGVVRREGNPVFTPAAAGKGKTSGTGTEAWKFRAVKPGEQMVRLEYMPPWSKTVPERSLRFTVSVR